MVCLHVKHERKKQNTVAICYSRARVRVQTHGPLIYFHFLLSVFILLVAHSFLLIIDAQNWSVLYCFCSNILSSVWWRFHITMQSVCVCVCMCTCICYGSFLMWSSTRMVCMRCIHCAFCNGYFTLKWFQRKRSSFFFIVVSYHCICFGGRRIVHLCRK